MNYKQKYFKYKKKYLQLKIKNTQIGGILNIINNNQMESDSGAGVILLEKYNGKLSIILLFDKFRNKFSDPGGSREPNENLKKTAIRELEEESKNLFRLNISALNDDIAVRHKTYIGYIVYITGPNINPIENKYYYHNSNLINSNSKSQKDYKETDGITRVYVDQLIKDGIINNNGDMNSIDVNGNKIKIFGRTVSVIRDALKTNLINDNHSKFLELKFNNNYLDDKNQKTFLNGTKTYYS